MHVMQLRGNIGNVLPIKRKRTTELRTGRSASSPAGLLPKGQKSGVPPPRPPTCPLACPLSQRTAQGAHLPTLPH